MLLRVYMNKSEENARKVLAKADELHKRGLEAEQTQQQVSVTETGSFAFGNGKFALVIYPSTDWNGAFSNLLTLRTEFGRARLRCEDRHCRFYKFFN